MGTFRGRLAKELGSDIKKTLNGDVPLLSHLKKCLGMLINAPFPPDSPTAI